MQIDSWVRKTQYKLFNKWIIFTREDTGNEYSGDEQMYQIVVSPEYYKSEFENKKDGST